MMTPLLITLPPPTPNGGLHVGHLSGPFLAADVLRRHAGLEGRPCRTVSYSDANQSYVRVTAERLRRDPDELARHHTQDILETLRTYGMGVDAFRYPDAESNGFVRDLVLRMHAAGALVKRAMPFFYSRSRACFLDEAGVSGFCPRCLAGCKCGICEACAFLTTAETLVAPRDTLSGGTDLEVRPVEVLVLDIERWRADLVAFYGRGQPFRPRYQWLVQDALAEALPAFPVTVPGDWGIAADCPDVPGQVVNPWAEVMGQLLFGYRAAATELGSLPAVVPAVVNVFGFDNSYFYAIVHAALFCAAGEANWLPRSVLINEFYNLAHRKFSTSGNHVIWARDLALRHSADAVRFYAAFNTPGFEKSNFVEADMGDVVADKLVVPWGRVVAAYNARLEAGNTGPSVSDEALRLGRAALARIGTSYSTRRFHMRQAAEDLLHLLGLIEARLGDARARLADATHLVAIFAQAACPIMPFAGQALFRTVAGRPLEHYDPAPPLRPARLPAGLFDAAPAGISQAAA